MFLERFSVQVIKKIFFHATKLVDSRGIIFSKSKKGVGTVLISIFVFATSQLPWQHSTCLSHMHAYARFPKEMCRPTLDVSSRVWVWRIILLKKSVDIVLISVVPHVFKIGCSLIITECSASITILYCNLNSIWDLRTSLPILNFSCYSTLS